MFKQVLMVISLFVVFFVCAVFAASDSLGVVGGLIDSVVSKFDQTGALAVLIIGFLSAAVYRVVQVSLQYLPTKWKWINNELTIGIVGKIIQVLFGKNVTLYNSSVDTDNIDGAKALRDELVDYYSK